MIPLRGHIVVRIYDTKKESKIIAIDKNKEISSLSFKVTEVSEECKPEIQKTKGKFISVGKHITLDLIHPDNTGDQYCLIHESGITGILDKADYQRIYNTKMPT